VEYVAKVNHLCSSCQFFPNNSEKEYKVPMDSGISYNFIVTF